MIFFLLSIIFQVATARTFLTADGPGNTYELINSKLAPGYNVIEAPDCGHSSFGRHIEEVFDSELNKLKIDLIYNKNKYLYLNINSIWEN